jgi:hypothetical protein
MDFIKVGKEFVFYVNLLLLYFIFEVFQLLPGANSSNFQNLRGGQKLVEFNKQFWQIGEKGPFFHLHPNYTH